MQVYRKTSIALIILLSLAGSLFATKGTVKHKLSDCDHFLVETNRGYALLEWYTGYEPNKGDIIVGDFESYGMKDIYDVTADAEIKVWIDNYWMDKEDALEEMYDECD